MHKSDGATAFKKLFDDTRTDGLPKIVRSDNGGDGGKCVGGEQGLVFWNLRVEKGLTAANSPQVNGVAEGGLRIITSEARS